MIHSSHNNSGFTFIEMMIALTMLATFGTSLFMVQSNILSKVWSTHRQITYSNDIEQAEFDLLMKVQQAVLQKKSPDNIVVEAKKKNPERSITVIMKPITEQSTLRKAFGKPVRFIQTTIAHDQYKDVWYSFIYIPEPKENEPSTKAESTTPKGNS